jgi:hypothetical protein
MSDHVVLISILILGVAIVAYAMLRSGENLRFETPSDPRRVVMAAVGIIATKRHWQVINQGEDEASFRYHRQPKALVAFVLLLCWLLPGFVYMVLAGKRESLVLNVYTDTAGITVAQVTSNGFRGKAAGRALARQISLAAGTLRQAQTRPESQAPSAQQTSARNPHPGSRTA